MSDDDTRHGRSPSPTSSLSFVPPEADCKRRHINYNEEEDEEEEGRDDRIVTHHGQSKEGIVDPPNDCNSLAIGTDPSSTKLDAKELASGKHSSDTDP